MARRFAIAVMATWLWLAPQASAQERTPVEPDFKATVGLGLVGAELGFVLPAVAGLRDAWAYVVFPVVGAGGGSLAGYFLIEKGTDSPELSVAMLATGMGLIIPAMIITLSASAYDPEQDVAARSRSAPAALVRITEGGVDLGTPSLQVAPSLGPREALRIGATRDRQVRVSLVSGRL